MCGGFFGLLKARRALAPAADIMIQQRANYIYCKQAKHKVSTMETLFVMTVMNLATLGPSGWILANLDHYKTRN
ncbi:hypothetical protein EPR50_G00014160 [Scomber scombrus]|uniref:Uncharacterized protein n=1 Tax=Scomber scombrus TaxID=13677 RepID=A0AAV1PRT9_SCOSC